MARKPSPEERALWQTATRDVRRRRRGAPQDVAPPPPPDQQEPLPREAPSVVPLGGGIDRRSAQRLRRGQMAIEGRLDLHGMTQDEAHRALTRYIVRAQDEGRRAVLVITGKGGLEGGGVLRRAVPRWLEEPANRAKVLAVEPAQPRHGGAGALYVLLRRRRAPE
jgi:DNA-nicking Smr family endonuclease